MVGFGVRRVGRAALVSAAGLIVAGATWISGRHDVVGVAAAPPAHCLDATAERTNAHGDMVWVPGGTFDMGDTGYPEEGPVRDVTVAGFWMDRHEVTNAEFASFVQATGYVTIAERPVDAARHPDLPADMQRPGALVFVMPHDVSGDGNPSQWWHYIAGADWRHPSGPQSSIVGRDDFPIVAVAYEDAVAYARWKGGALPTEAQWEWAARGGAPRAAADGQPRQANTWQGVFPVLDSGADGFVGLAPVGCFKPNDFGFYDMIGNAWEWTSDLYVAGEIDRISAPESGGAVRRVIKGGSYLCAPTYCHRYRAGARHPQEEDLAAGHLGFRTVRNGLD